MKRKLVAYLVALVAGCGGLSGYNNRAETTETATAIEAAEKPMSMDSASVGNKKVFSGTYPTITFSLKNNSYFFKPQLKVTADSALKIASAVYNSQEFKDSLSKYSFRCRSFGYRCAQQCSDCNRGRFSIKTVFDSLYRQANVGLTLHLDEKGDGFGSTSADSYLITSNYQGVYDDYTMPFSYHYAVHLCHEYMHNVGYFHFEKPKHRVASDDVAEEVGIIAYNILERWYKAGIKPL